MSIYAICLFTGTRQKISFILSHFLNIRKRTNTSKGYEPERSSYDDGNRRKGQRVRESKPFVRNFDARPISIWQEIPLLSDKIKEHNPQTDKR